MIKIIFLIFVASSTLSFGAVSKPKRGRYHKMPEIYSYRTARIVEEEEPQIEPSTSKAPQHRITSSFSLEDYIETAVSGDSLEWQSLPQSEYPRADTSDLTAQHTIINVPLFYGQEAAQHYGITQEKIERSFFAIYLRKYHWGAIDPSQPVKHVILVAGGPGESGKSWTGKLHKLSKQYGRSNLVLYVADHRGVYKSRDIVELITKETDKGKTRISWRKNRRNEFVYERDWIKNVPEFEKSIGYPLVAMTCSNAARDLALISLVIRKHMTKSNGKNARIYLHAQSYGTQVVTRTLNLLPEFYDGVLLEGLATMELVKESAKADFGILSSCAEDRKCLQMFSMRSTGDLLPLRGPFDLRNLLEEMAKRSHNQACRDVFLSQMRTLVYSSTISFWDAVHLSFYELLADDFLNPYTGTRGNFYPGMLVLPLIRDMYYCQDIARFRRQVDKIVELIAISVRGLKQSYVKTPPGKSKPSDSTQISSYFVQTYINAHEAFDMRSMSRGSEKDYCDRPHQPDLVNQCPIWKEQVRKLGILSDLSEPVKTKKESKPTDKRRAKLDKFEGKQKSSSLSSLSSEDYSSDESSDNSSSTTTTTTTSTTDSGSFYKSNVKKLFTFTEDKKKTKKKKTKKMRKSKRRDYSSDDGKKWLKQPKTFLDDFDQVKNKGPKKTSPSPALRRYYYDVDDLAYQIPRTSKTKIFVTVGSLDIKTPLLEAQRLLARIQSPLKILFELKNVAHSTDHCRGEIVRALVADSDQYVALGIADECVREVGSARKLDWQLEEVKNISKDDWIL